jgi:hypothetical protein
MKTIIIALASVAMLGCQKEDVRPATRSAVEKVNAPMKGTWQMVAFKEQGSSTYTAFPPDLYLHISNTFVTEWGPYTYNSTHMHVTHTVDGIGQEEDVAYKIGANIMTLDFVNGGTWKVLKTAP